MLLCNFVNGFNFIIFCFKLIILHYHTQKQKRRKFKTKDKTEPQHKYMTYYSLIYEKLGNWNKAVSRSKSVESGFKNTHTPVLILILLFERHLKNVYLVIDILITACFENRGFWR